MYFAHTRLKLTYASSVVVMHILRATYEYGYAPFEVFEVWS